MKGARKWGAILALISSFGVGCAPIYVKDKPAALHEEIPQEHVHTLIHDYLDIEISSGLVDSTSADSLDRLIADAQELYTPDIDEDPTRILGKIDDLLTEKNWVYVSNLFLSEALMPSQLSDEIKTFFKDDYFEGISRDSIKALNYSDSTKTFLRRNHRKLDHIAAHVDEDFHFADCDNFSHTYLAIIESLKQKGLKLNAYAVRAPRHIFLCVHTDKENVYWETLFREKHSSHFYKKRYNIKKAAIDKHTYLKDLTRKESIFAHAHLIVGYRFKKQERYEEALEHFNKAVTLDPNYASAYPNLGHALKKLGNKDEAAAMSAQYRKMTGKRVWMGWYYY